MHDALTHWSEAAITTLGLFWMAFWAFGLGYLVSSAIQVFVTEARMRQQMGDSGVKSVGLATVFGFISSSCSFAALSTARSLFTKGAGLVPSLAFLLASTNLVVELGIVIGLFLSWQFVAAEYVGGVMLIGLTWLLVRLTLPDGWEEEARQHASAQERDAGDADAIPDWRERITSVAGWRDVARTYLMEWRMVWKDVTVGFTVAGVIAAFVPARFFEALFVGAGQPDPSIAQIGAQALVGPLAAFFTFIGSMGNIPLAAVLFSHGVSFAGVMAFIFSDLVVFPVLRIQARYYGWKMALYVVGVFLAALIATSLLMHLGFASLDLLPDPAQARDVVDRTFFKVDTTLALNLLFMVVTVGLFSWALRDSGDDDHSDHEHDDDHEDHDHEGGHDHHDHGDDESVTERVLFWLAMLSYAWLAAGLALKWFVV